jgi:NADP-dependent 3-hydroxy acid dehydrogenase YdfG
MKTWFITGCSTGFGRDLATAALKRGHRVAVTARNPDAVADIVALEPERALPLAMDVTDPAQVTAAVRAAEGRFGGIDVLVNNAGIGYFAAVEESSWSEVRRMFEINVFALADVTNKVLPGMRARRSGTIVNISSVGGVRAFPAVGWYNASKFAVEGLSEALRQETSASVPRGRLVQRKQVRRRRFVGGSAPGDPTLGDRRLAGRAERICHELGRCIGE